MPPIFHLEETASTNSYLKDFSIGFLVEEGTIVSTKHQTSGRGQRGNGWESEKGKNLTFSMILYPTFIPIIEQFILSQIVSLSIKEVLDEYSKSITIKWPNDIYWQEKKICGILIENTISESKITNCIIGIGINVNQEKFDSDAPNPISLTHITKEKHDLETILTTLQTQILSHYERAKEGNISPTVEKYKESLFRKDGFYFYHDGEKEFEAQIIDVEPSGHLILKTKDNEIRKFAFKEVKYLF